MSHTNPERDKVFKCRHVRFVPVRGSTPPIEPAAPPEQSPLVPLQRKCHQCKVGVLNPKSGRYRAEAYCDRCLDIQEAELRESRQNRIKMCIRTVPCGECGVEVELGPKDRVKGRLTGYRLCESCSVIMDARIAQENKVHLEAYRKTQIKTWRVMCPSTYRIQDLDEPDGPDGYEDMTDPSRLPQQLLDIVKSWHYGTRGMYLIGKNRLQKTRAIMLRMRALFVEENIDCRYVFSVTLADQIRGLAMEDARKLNIYVDALIRVPVLFIDDLGKERCTDKVAEELIKVVEQRTIAGRPILATTNLEPEFLGLKIDRDSGAEAVGGSSSGRGIAIVSRLADYGDFVSVD